MTKVCAAAMLVRDSKILLGKRAPGQLLYPDVWDLPADIWRSASHPTWRSSGS